MHVNAIRSGSYSDPAVGGKRSEPAESRTDQLQETLAAWPTATGSAADALREILAEYDVTDITPREFSEMLQKLRKAGVISEETMQEIASVRLDLEHDSIDPDESVNLLDYYAQKLAARRRADQTGSIFQEDQPRAALLAQRLDWMEKFALLQSGTDAPLDTTA